MCKEKKVRGFEVVTERKRKVGWSEIILPKRATKTSAGYDFYACESVVVPGLLTKTKMLINSLGITAFTSMVRGDTEIKHTDELSYNKPTLVSTGIKAYMGKDEVLKIYVNSSTPKKMGLMLANGTGIIDSDYYSNDDNDGNIMFAFYNFFPFDRKINAGDRIGQGIFSKFLVSDNGNSDEERIGGFGSTQK